MTDTIALNARYLDLSKRVAFSTAVTGSPAAAAETIIATAPALDAALTFMSGCLVMCWAAYTLGTSASACTVRIRQTGLSGTVIVTSGAQTGGHNTATQLVADDITGFDTAPAVGQVYVMTLQVTGGAAASTVSAANIVVLAI